MKLVKNLAFALAIVAGPSYGGAMPDNVKEESSKSEALNWKLDDVVKRADFDSLYAETIKDLAVLDDFYKKLNPDMSEAEFRKFVEFDEALTEKYSRLNNLPDLMEEADKSLEDAKLLKGKADDLEIMYNKAYTKVEHWLMGKALKGKKVLDDKNARRLFRSVPDLEYFLAHQRQESKYTLSEKEEIMSSDKDANLGTAIQSLRAEITNDFRFTFKPEGAKEGREIETEDEIRGYFRSGNPFEREAAYRSMLNKYKDNIAKFFIIYQAVVKDWDYDARVRNYAFPISRRNFKNHVPDEAIKTLLEVTVDNRDVYQQYFKWKARQLGVDKLRRFDIYAPLDSAEKAKIPFSEGRKIVLDSLLEFSQGFASRAERIFDEQHIDSHPRKNKSPGAFCSTVSPHITPYVLMNYVGDKESVETLAHELGHAIHSMYSEVHSVSSQDVSLPLAETASTFSEMIIFEKLFAKAGSDAERKAMLSAKMADSYATVMRQSYFVAFEIKAHEAIGKGITPTGLSDMYLDTLKEQFGDSVEVDDIFKYEWVYIPHIVHAPFYCYAYNFGELLSLALYSKYKEEGRGFVPKIEKILSYGGSEDPQKVLKEVGIDMTQRDFWQGAFDVIRQWQSQLESYK